MYALLLSAAAAAAFGELEDAAVVLAVVVLNTIIGFLQEYRAGRAIAALAELVAEPALVRRDDAWIEVPAELVVPGRRPLRGGGRPCERRRAAARTPSGCARRRRCSPANRRRSTSSPMPAPPEAPLAERHSMLHAGTVVAAGTGLGVAVATGADDPGRADLGAARCRRPAADAADARAGPPRADGHGGDRRRGRAARDRGRGPRLPARRRRSRGHQPRRGGGPGGAARPWSRSRWRSACGGWRAGGRSSATCPAVETLGSHHGRRVGQDGHADPQPDDGAGGVDARTPATSRTSCCSRACCATTPRSRAATGGTSATRPRRRCSSTPPRAGSTPTRRARAHPRLDALPFDSGRKLMATRHAVPGGGTVVYVKGAPEAVLPLCADAAHRRGRAGRAARGRGPARARAGRGDRRRRHRSRTSSAVCASSGWRP